MTRRRWLGLLGFPAGVLGCLLVGQPSPRLARAAAGLEQATPPAQSYVSRIRPWDRHAFFGELHVHTTMSLDAWTFGAKVTPDQAFKFGRGEPIEVPAAQVAFEQGGDPKDDVTARRAWPLDFMAVTDHAEQMGLLSQLDDPASALARSPAGKGLLARLGERGAEGGSPLPGSTVLPASDPAVARDAWALEQHAANSNYFPGRFTTFIAYEWTSGSIHRNVIFNGNHAPAPFTSADSRRPEDLWTYLESTRASGVDVLAIPHNANESDGGMFDWTDSAGRPIIEDYALRRARNEPLTEITQIKGTSDTVPQLSPTDEFANFEIFDRLGPRRKSFAGAYVRDALGRGLVIQSKVGVNPYRYGVVGGSDIHNGLSASDEKAFAGGQFGIDPDTMTPKGDWAKGALGMLRGRGQAPPITADLPAAPGRMPVKFYPLSLARSSAGLTGVWAEENTRNSIFAALKRKETFATSGVRMRVRMFGGWSFDSRMLSRRDWLERAYETGAPMGSDMPARSGSGPPVFVVQAMKDPTGANLDRVQMIKLSLDGHGGYSERIFDIALSGARKVDPRTGKAPPVGDTVDLKTGKYSNLIGMPAFTVLWRDPEFDPRRAAAYFARVLEIPTPRWSTLLAIKNGLPLPEGAPPTIQERGWASPIWYSPQGSVANATPGGVALEAPTKG